MDWKKVFVKDESKDLLEMCKIAIVVRSETWCMRENERAILKRIEEAMCGVKLIEKRDT